MNFFTDPDAFAAAVGPEGVLIGLDPGTKTIGVAVCDVRRSLASPLQTIQRTKLTNDLQALRSILERREALGIVLGMPFNMDGTPGRRAQSVRAFSRSIEDAFGLPVLHWDERLSSFAAKEAMVAAQTSRAKREARIDAEAASIILQGAIERLEETASGA